jgi:TolB-like protein/Flp pilus assembly protein TadD
LDLGTGELLKAGVRIKLQEQPLQFLAILLESAGQVVTREELRKRLWPADTFVDFEHGLNKSINKIREALDDSAEHPRYIETLPRRGYRFLEALEPKKAARIQSLVVLPLENLSHDPQQEFFADGITEALITHLAKISALRVVSRTSAQVYKGVRKPLPEIARELRVDAVIEGAVLRSGDRVRISAQLINALTDTHLWAETYDRDLRDILALQMDVALAIAREVEVKLSPLDQARFPKVRPIDPAAYEAYLKGRYEWLARSRDGHRKAVQYFQDAIAIDSSYAAAFTGLADSLSILGLWGLAPPVEACGRAKSLALHALEMDKNLPEAHVSLAWATAHFDYDFVAAEKEFERALELNPRYPIAHHWFGMVLAAMGRYEESYTELKRAVSLEPHSSLIHFGSGFMYWAARRYPQAIRELELVLKLDPKSVQGHVWLGITYVSNSQNVEAISTLKKAVELSEGTPVAVACLAEAYAAAGLTGDAERILSELLDLKYVTSYFVARIYAALGKIDEALRLLECAYREHGEWMVLIKVDPRFDNLRSDSRFQELLRSMNFPL